ncbi:MAG: DUF4150 domain-containing protein [Polyangiaceae bacterium]|nr:DUF4150 domain-containing protein [Polyangiaceae bacterium]
MKRELARACPEGIIMSIMPDVCLTPTATGAMVPVSYFIRARAELAIDTNPKHRVDGYPVITMKSRIPTCEGNEAGTGGGVISGVNKGWCRPLEHSTTQKSGGEWVVRVGDLWAMNCAGPDGMPNTHGRFYIIVRVSAPATTPISKTERTSVDAATGQIVLESMEVVRYPITGEVVEIRQRTTLDPNTGQAATESMTITTKPDGTKSYVHHEGAFDPEYNQYAWKTTERGEVDTLPPDEADESTELGEPAMDDAQPGGFFLQDESEVFRPLARPSDEISDTDPEVLADPEVQAALAEQAACEAEMADVNKELAWEAAKLTVDGVGIVDPTPVCDLVGAGMALVDRDWAGAGLSVAGAALPFAGDAIAKPLKASRAGVRMAKLWAKLEALTLRMSKLKDKVRKALDRVKDSIAKRRAGAGGAGGGGGGLPEPPKPSGPGDGSVVAKAVKKDYTVPSGKPGGKPRGEPEPVQGNAETRHKLARQHEAADTLAARGYDVEHNHDLRPGTSRKPDYRIEGRYFDCYTPTVSKTKPRPNNKSPHGTKAIGRARDEISEKVAKRQTDRVVVNLDDTDITPSEMQAILQRRPIDGLKEVITIKNGNIQHIFP